MAGFKKVMLTERENSLTSQVSTDTAIKNEVFSENYTNDKLNDLYKQFDAITLDENTLELAKEEKVEKVKASARQKLVLTTSIIVAVLLLFLAVYNIFVINAYAGDINILKKDIAKQEYDIANKTRSLDNLTNIESIKADLIEQGYSAEALNNIAYVELPDTGNVEDETIKGNWWDSFCDFISSLFGG